MLVLLAGGQYNPSDNTGLGQRIAQIIPGTQARHELKAHSGAEVHGGYHPEQDYEVHGGVPAGRAMPVTGTGGVTGDHYAAGYGPTTDTGYGDMGGMGGAGPTSIGTTGTGAPAVVDRGGAYRGGTTGGPGDSGLGGGMGTLGGMGTASGAAGGYTGGEDVTGGYGTTRVDDRAGYGTKAGDTYSAGDTAARGEGGHEGIGHKIAKHIPGTEARREYREETKDQRGKYVVGNYEVGDPVSRHM